jgi:hypothetical protein
MPRIVFDADHAACGCLCQTRSRGLRADEYGDGGRPPDEYKPFVDDCTDVADEHGFRLMRIEVEKEDWYTAREDE